MRLLRGSYSSEAKPFAHSFALVDGLQFRQRTCARAMAFLESVGRNASIYMGITAPRPEHERIFGVVILATAVLLIAGTAGLVVLMTHLVFR